MRAIRSQTALPSITAELQSSDAERVTTETTIGSPSGEYSKQSFAQVRSSRQSASTPASNREANSTSTRALNRKSPVVVPTRAGASSLATPVPGSTNQSVCGPAAIVSDSSSADDEAGATSQRRENGRFTARDYC